MLSVESQHAPSSEPLTLHHATNVEQMPRSVGSFADSFPSPAFFANNLLYCRVSPTIWEVAAPANSGDHCLIFNWTVIIILVFILFNGLAGVGGFIKMFFFRESADFLYLTFSTIVSDQ